MHTSEASACAVNTAEEQVYSYKQRGYTGIIITDHFVNGYTTCPPELPWEKKMQHFVTGYNNAKKAGDECGLDVFLGWEYSIRGSDFLTYGLGMDFLLANPDFDKLEIGKYSALVRKNGGYIAQAHPYREAWYVHNQYPVASHLLDGIEVYNPMDSEHSNSQACLFAERNDLPMQAGSDSHSINSLHYTGIKLSKKAEDIFDIIEAIKSGDAVVIR